MNQAGNFAPSGVIQFVSFTFRVISVDGDIRITTDEFMRRNRISAGDKTFVIRGINESWRITFSQKAIHKHTEHSSPEHS